MQCPIDQAELVMSERSGIEIDYCPKCRGIWLDRGELDKIIERSDSQLQSNSRYKDAPSSERRYQSEHDGFGGHGRRKESWLGELFG